MADASRQRSIVFGAIGAVIGFVAFVALAGLLDFGRNDPIAAGMAVLLVIGPIGGFLGAWLLIWLSKLTPGAKEDAARRDGQPPS